MFAPHLGPGAPLEPRHFGSLRDLTLFLEKLKIDPAAQRLAMADLERSGTGMVPNVLLTMSELRDLSPTQFSETHGVVRS